MSDRSQETTTPIPGLCKSGYYLDEFLNNIWQARVTFLNPMGINFSRKTCD